MSYSVLKNIVGLIYSKRTILVWCCGVMTIHITDLGVEGCKRVCILYDCRRERTPAGKWFVQKKKNTYWSPQRCTDGWVFDDVVGWPWFCVRRERVRGGGFQLFYIFLMKAVAVTENLEL